LSIARQSSVTPKSARTFPSLPTHSTYALKPRDASLVHAAAGGADGPMAPAAKMPGARVFGSVSTDEMAAIAPENGVDEAILSTRMEFDAEIRRLTNGRGVDVVYDPVGKTTFEKSLNSLRPRSLLALFGQSSGPVPPSTQHAQRQ
jgi:NADPH2:quinone reductase